MRGGVRKRGERWAAFWDLPLTDGQRRRQGTRSGFATKKAAQAFLTVQLRAIQTGEFVERDVTTLAGWFDRWHAGASVRLKPTTADKYLRDFDRYVRPSLGSVRLQALTPLHLDGLYAGLLRTGGSGPVGGTRSGEGLSPTSVGHVHRLLHKVLADALRKGLVVRNAAAAATPPKQVQPWEHHNDVWTPEQMRAFLAAVAEDRLFALWRLLVMTGCRRGEAVGLHWSDLDLDDGAWTVRRALVVVNGQPTEGTPKSGRTRCISLDPATVAALRVHHRAQAAERLAWGPAYQDSGYVFANEDGTLLHPNTLTKRFAALAERVGLPHIRLHDLRHSAITASLARGVPMLVVSERAGHASTAFTMNQYGHVTEAMGRDAATRLAEAVDG